MNVAGFVQDDWRVIPKLIVNLGLRYSYVSPIRADDNLLGSFNPTLGLVQQGQPSVGDTLWKPDYKDFSPRAGFAWDLSGKGTTVIRGGVSLMYSTYTSTCSPHKVAIPELQNGTFAAVPTGGCTTTVAPGTRLSGNLWRHNRTAAPVSAAPTSAGMPPAQQHARLASAKQWFSRLAPGSRCTASSQCDVLTVEPESPHPLHDELEPREYARPH